ncbi:type I secretion system permease/ATPase [Arenibaculum pallidiluteum]|uniref:type I secretion system permease/ATPase n=1 Tax=Arenibaculum pallidiluteum TaxID=2812559 RepID=UPI001A9574A5|nr:ATP-binding cassette domain-containing protein [Arenibaculum pallidiluteum]
MSTQFQTRPKRAVPVPGLRTFRTALIAGISFSAAINILMLALPLYSLQVFTRAIPTGNYDTLVMITVVTVLALTMASALEALRTKLFARAGTYLDVAFRPRLLAEHAEGGQRSRAAQPLLNDLSELRAFLGRPQFQGLLDLPWFPLYAVAIFVIHPLLGAVLAVGTLALVALAVISEMLTARWNEGARQVGSRGQRLAESLSAQGETVRALRVQEALLDRWSEAALAANAQSGVAADRVAVLGTITRWVRYMVQIGAYGVAATLVMEHHLSFGAMIATSMLIGKAMTPIDQITGGWGPMLRSIGAWRRVVPALRLLSGHERSRAGVDIRGRIVVDNALVLAGREQKPVLRNVSFELQPGELLCVFGPNRSGKSTLGKLLTGSLRPYAGAVRIDGIDAADIRPADPLRGIAYVSEQADLLPGTIAENIARYIDVDRAEIERTASEFGLHEVIRALPQGYDTDVLEARTNGQLSGGTERLIALARAGFGDPRIVVLDEAVTNLDMPGHEAVRRFLARCRQRGATVVVLSHQSTFLEVADKVLVLKDGTVAAYGPRDQVVRPQPRRAAVAAGAE